MDDLHPLREHLDDLLSQDLSGSDDSLKEKVLEYIELVYHKPGADPDVLDDVTQRYRAAFKLDSAGHSVAVECPSTEFENVIRSYGGFPARYLEFVEEQESPAQYHFAALLTTASGGFARRGRMIDWYPDQPFPNLYTLLVGPSGGRKNAALGLARRLLAEPFDLNVMPSEGTPQGYANIFRQRYVKTGMADGIFMADEFKVLVSDEKNKKELATWLTDWYDCKETWDRALKADPDYDVRNWYVCVCAGSTMEWLRRIPIDAIQGGFIPRFIMFAAGGKRHWKALPRFSNTLRRELTEHLKGIPDSIPDGIRFDPATIRAIERWYEQDLQAQANANGHVPGLDKWFERKQAAVLKTAVVWQILDRVDPDVLHKEYFERALVVIDLVEQGMISTYRSLNTTMEGESSSDILTFIRSCGGIVSQRAIYKQFREKYRRARIAEGIDTLKSSGEIESIAVPGQGFSWRVTQS